MTYYKDEQFAQCPQCGLLLVGFGELQCYCGGSAMAGSISKERADEVINENSLANAPDWMRDWLLRNK